MTDDQPRLIPGSGCLLCHAHREIQQLAMLLLLLLLLLAQKKWKRLQTETDCNNKKREEQLQGKKSWKLQITSGSL